MTVASEIVPVLQHHHLYSKTGIRKNNVEYHNNGGLQDESNRSHHSKNSILWNSGNQITEVNLSEQAALFLSIINYPSCCE